MSLSARIQRIDHPQRGVLALTVRAEGERRVLVVSARPSMAGVGVVPERPRGAAADAFALGLRRVLVGGVVLAVRRLGRAWELELGTNEGPHRLWAIPRGPGGTLVLKGADGRARFICGPSLPDPAGPENPVDTTEDSPLGWEALRDAGAALETALRNEGPEQRRRELSRAIARSRKRLTRKLSAIEADAARADEVPQLRAAGTALLTHLYQLDPDATELSFFDYTSDPPVARVVALDRRLGPKRQAEALFHAARRLERGAKIATDRWTVAASELASIEALAQRLETEDDLGAIEEDAESQGLALDGQAAPRKAGRATTRRPYRAFRSEDGVPILVGRSAADNDRLTLGHTKPHHLWLHARGVPGSHVVVALDKGQACSPGTLADAATLAAHFSSLKSDPEVEVQYTPRRYVRKPRGAAAGSVLVEREKVILLVLQPARITRLLSTERR